MVVKPFAGEIEDAIREAIRRYKKVPHSYEVILPTASVGEREFDPNVFLKEMDAEPDVEEFGEALMIVYAQKKGPSDETYTFIHVFDKPAIILKGRDSNLLILPEAKLTEKGIEG